MIFSMKPKIRKIYCDFISHNGIVGVIYLLQIEFAGLYKEYAALELYLQNGSKKVIHANSHKFETKLIQGTCNLKVDLIYSKGSIELTYEYTKPIPHSPPYCIDEGMFWQVLLSKGKIRLTISTQAKKYHLTGIGYVDYVKLNHFPRDLNLKSLKWGRIHEGGSDYVFTEACFRNKKLWKSIITYDEGNIVDQTCEYHILDNDEVTTVRLIENGRRSSFIHLFHLRTIHEGKALNLSRVPGLIERLFYSLLGGYINESRYLSQSKKTNLDISEPNTLHETVWFTPVR